MKILLDHGKCTLCKRCISVCPFSAIEEQGGQIEFGQGCRFCRLCVKNCPEGAISIQERVEPNLDKLQYQGVLVVVEHNLGEIHPITYELLGKGRKLADVMGQSLTCIMIGSDVLEPARGLLDYGVDRVYVYDHPELLHFRVEPYANAIENLVVETKPSIILVGATPTGRSLAPRVAVRFRTGLTADCTVLDVKPNSDLVQIRPAFGGNIMAQIVTPNHRPQMATVRYKVMDAAEKRDTPSGQLISRTLSADLLASGVRVLTSHPKPPEENIADAEILVAVGRGLKEKKDMQLIGRLAFLLGGKVGVTRPLVEVGWADHSQQIGLSGRAVRPKLLITCGISGAIQFAASITGAEHIFAINKDPRAPIFDAAHFGLVGDLYQIVPKLIGKLEGGATVESIL